MIIKSHIRGGYRSAAEYLKEQGKNEKTRLVEISDPSASNLDEAFHNMWTVASNTRCKKPLHHISINPMKGEYLTDEQVLRIVERCEEKYGYKPGHHQRVIVEHIKDGRQHFHVIWNRVDRYTNRTVWPGEHWKKSKQVCREMEVELGLRRPTPRRKHKTKHRASKKYGTARPAEAKHTVVSQRAEVWPWRYRPFTIRPHIHTHVYAGEREAIQHQQVPFRPVTDQRDWPLLAIIHWDTWGKRNPRRFFALWPELSR